MMQIAMIELRLGIHVCRCRRFNKAVRAACAICDDELDDGTVSRSNCDRRPACTDTKIELTDFYPAPFPPITAWTTCCLWQSMKQDGSAEDRSLMQARFRRGMRGEIKHRGGTESFRDRTPIYPAAKRGASDRHNGSVLTNVFRELFRRQRDKLPIK
ncbi:MAG TPA: hypothetical protein VN229_05190 [Terriglobales bacterium]|nr:hypothetical protein [Terriglobales bacterium]